jgi:hypothetical protein
MVSETKRDKAFPYPLSLTYKCSKDSQFEVNSRDFKWLAACTSGAEDARVFIESPLKTTNGESDAE